MRQLRVVLATALGVAVLFPVLSHAQPTTPFDHLKCYKITDYNPKNASVTYQFDLTPEQTQFLAETGCILKNKAKWFCIDVQKTNVTAVKSNVSPPPTPLPIQGQDAQDYLCYPLKCPLPTPLPTPNLQVADQFGLRKIVVKKPDHLCVPAQKVKVVFVRLATTAGDFGGAAAADTLCQQAAVSAGLPGMFRAWVSDSTTSPSLRFVPSAGPYVRTDGAFVANNWSDLTDGSLINPINLDEFGNLIVPIPNGIPPVWTATNPDGTAAATSCSDWTSSSSGGGIAGDANASNSSWTVWPQALNCFVQAHLYCFEQ